MWNERTATTAPRFADARLRRDEIVARANDAEVQRILGTSGIDAP
jgi:hypothetical protein